MRILWPSGDQAVETPLSLANLDGFGSFQNQRRKEDQTTNQGFQQEANNKRKEKKAKRKQEEHPIGF